MNQLEMLWKLQNIDKEISVLRKATQDKRLLKDTNCIKESYKALKLYVGQMEAEQNTAKTKISFLYNDLEKINSRLKEADAKLYENENIARTFNNIQKEIVNYKEMINKVENEIIELMEKVEILDKEINRKNEELTRLRSDFDRLKSEFIYKNANIKVKLEMLGNEKNILVKGIDKVLFEQYTALALNSKTAVSMVIDGVCTDCGVRLNAIIYDRIKRVDEINFCEHCGRILYIEH